jgi:hypothetical protein
MIGPSEMRRGVSSPEEEEEEDEEEDRSSAVPQLFLKTSSENRYKGSEGVIRANAKHRRGIKMSSFYERSGCNSGRSTKTLQGGSSFSKNEYQMAAEAKAPNTLARSPPVTAPKGTVPTFSCAFREMLWLNYKRGSLS